MMGQFNDYGGYSVVADVCDALFVLFYLLVPYGTFRCQKDFLRRETPFDTGVLGCRGCLKVSEAISDFLIKK